MSGATTDSLVNKRVQMVATGPLFIVGGFALNYLLERHNIFKLWENSDYPISWADFSYPPICVLLCITGILMSLGGAFHRTTIWKSVAYSAAIALPLTALYAIFVFGMQFIATGADRLGECPGLDEAASDSNVIPESLWRKGHAAVGCAVERRGIFLSYCNDLGVYGVSNTADQQRVLDEVTKHYRTAHNHPVQIRFLEREKVSIQQGKKGVVIGQKTGPSKLIRVVNID